MHKLAKLTDFQERKSMNIIKKKWKKQNENEKKKYINF